MTNKLCNGCEIYKLNCADCKSDKVSSSPALAGSIAWISVKDKLPKKGQYVLVYRNTSNRRIAVQAITWWPGDEEEHTHWAPIEPPKQ